MNAKDILDARTTAVIAGGLDVALTMHEYCEAHWRAFVRDRKANTYRMAPTNGADMSIGPHVMGAAGERAAAKALCLDWDQFLDGDGGIDFPPDIGIRTTLDGRYCRLKCYPNDADRYRFVLVIMRKNLTVPSFTLAGWMYGSDAKQQRYWGSPNDRALAYFVPVADLRPMSEFRS